MSQVVFITGANRGIGLALCQYYCAQGADVIATCRSSTDELDKTGAQIIENIDVSGDLDVENLIEQIGHPAIDLLINNAGIFLNETLEAMSFSNIERQYQVNAIGPLRITHALLGLLKAGSKIAMITSRMGSISDNTSGHYYGYRMSKSALNMASVSLAHDLRSRQIAVGIIHPGFVQTEMVGFAGDISAQTAAEGIAQRIEGLNMENSGQFWHSNGQSLAW